MKIFLRIRSISCLLVSFFLLNGIILAQEGDPRVMTGEDYDHYWTGKGNPNMSEKAIELTNPKEVYLEEDGYLIMECEDSYFSNCSRTATVRPPPPTAAPFGIPLCAFSW